MEHSQPKDYQKLVSTLKFVFQKVLSKTSVAVHRIKEAIMLINLC